MDLNYKYSKAVIYNIFFDDRLLYTGSTINFPNRKKSHKYYYYNSDRILYKKMKEENIDFEDLQFIIYKKFPCNDKKELYKEEGLYIKELKPEFNERIEGRTKEEYIKDNKEKILEYQKEYWIENKEKIQQRHKEYNDKNKEKIKEYQKEYNEKNKEKIKEKKKNYDKIRYIEKKEDKLLCECGIEIYKNYKTKHEKTKKHIDIMLEKEKI